MIFYVAASPPHGPAAREEPGLAWYLAGRLCCHRCQDPVFSVGAVPLSICTASSLPHDLSKDISVVSMWAGSSNPNVSSESISFSLDQTTFLDLDKYLTGCFIFTNHFFPWTFC